MQLDENERANVAAALESLLNDVTEQAPEDGQPDVGVVIVSRQALHMAMFGLAKYLASGSSVLVERDGVSYALPKSRADFDGTAYALSGPNEGQIVDFGEYENPAEDLIKEAAESRVPQVLDQYDDGWKSGFMEGAAWAYRKNL